MKTYNDYVFKASMLLLLFALLIISCHQEDDHSIKQSNSVEEQTKMAIVSAKEIPEVLNFIQSKSNSRLEFIIDDNDSELGAYRSHEENLSLTTTMTEEIKQVTNGYGKSNYTLMLMEEQDKEDIHFLNLVVKEYANSMYLYITKYVPDPIWLNSYHDISDFGSFTGAVYFYSDEGEYLAKADMLNGISTVVDRHSCNGNSETNNGESTSENSGSGGTTNSGTSDGSSDTNNSSNSGSNNGSGESSGNSCVNTGMEWAIVDCPEWCGCESGICGVWVSVWDCGGPNHSMNELDKGFNDFLRHACDDLPEVCYEANGDPCFYGCNETGDGCADEPDEVEENTDVGVFIDLDLILQLNEIFGLGNYEFDNTLTNEETLNFNSIEEIESFLDDMIENNFENTSSTMQADSIREDVHIMHYNSFPAASIVANVRVRVPDDNNDLECLELIYLDTNLEGNISLFDWTQTSSGNPDDPNGPLVTIDEENDRITYTIIGEMLVGLAIFDMPSIRARKLITIEIVYQYSTGE